MTRMKMRLRELRKYLEVDADISPSNHYDNHEERIQGHIGRIHNEAGPIPNCDCQICRYYHNTKTVGPEHTNTGCACWVCEKERERIAKSKGLKYIPHSRRKMGKKVLTHLQY